MIELKPCPFCGNKMIQVEKIGTTDFWMTRCLECDVLGPGAHRSADQASRAWNKRFEFKTKLSSIYGKFARGE